MKFNWVKKLAAKLPKHVWEERREEIKSYVTGSRQEIEEQVEASLCRQIKIVVMGSVIFLILLTAMALSWLFREQQIVITRNERGGEVKEESLKIQTNHEAETYSLSVQPKGYSKKELPEVLKKGEKYLEKHLKGENTSVNEVKKALFMPVKIPGENMEVRWESSDPAVIDEEGNVFSKNVKEPVIVHLSAILTCQKEKRIAKFPVCVIPGTSGKKKTEKQKIIEMIQKIEQEQINKESFALPQNFKNGTVSKEQEDNKIPAVICLGSLGILLLWYRENERYRKKKKYAQIVSVREYPTIIYRLILYLETGLSVPLVLEAVFREYQMKKAAGKTEEIFVYEQIGTACRQMNFGMPQTEVFKNFGKNLQLPDYRKLSTLLIQSMTKGSKELFLRLREEEEGAFFRRKEEAKRQGEEASTKLLGPMIVMLAVILILLMFPAFTAFS